MDQVGYWLTSYGTDRWYWVGAQNTWINGDTEAIWTSNTDPVDVSLWAPGEPDNSAGNCVYLNQATNRLHIGYCLRTAYPLCKPY